MERLMIDAAHIKIHPYAVEAKGGNEGMSHTKGGLNARLHHAADIRGIDGKIRVS